MYRSCSTSVASIFKSMVFLHLTEPCSSMTSNVAAAASSKARLREDDVTCT